MEIDKLDEVLEAILLIAGDSVAMDDLTEKLELQKSELKNSITRLQQKYSGKCGIYLKKFNNRLQFCTNPEYSDIVAGVLNPIKEKELSRASMEVMAIVAYKQPITRLEIDNVRGVNSDYAVQMLLKHNLIKVVGRKDAVGKPLLYASTDDFLRRFGLESLELLPDYDELMERIKVVPVEAPVQSLYNEFKIAEPEDEDEQPQDGQDEGNTSAAQQGEDNASAAQVAAEQTTDDLPDEEVPDFLKDEKDLQIIK